ncbi:CD99 antigen-like protein 2 isoform X4 [Oncorhynchus kisutch]|uniref:CD99 antigen-like protein 2 isoform X4 n=1 Tax=Oncorhynchus kisutch TaxID=8019 RepID=UPI0012DDA51F|nr:CD99 antigen-like protein 2 isoform X4 [Oncorhynchus kisutch]
MKKCSAWSLFLVVSLLTVKALSQNSDGFDLSDALDDVSIATATPKAVEGAGADEEITPTKAPPKAPATKAPSHKPKPPSDEFDLSDALDPNNDIGGKDKNKGQAGGHGGGQSAADDNNLDTMAETGTIAGIISAIGLALVGAVTSYVSYQKKKLCFSIQQSLNADLVKTDNPDAVVATEPQVQQTLLEPPNAEPPSQDNTV